MDARAWLEQVEEGLSAGDERDVLPALALLAGQSVRVDEGELHAARRRALLLLATGGDPRRALGIEARAVRSVAADLVTREGTAELAAGLRTLLEQTEGLPRTAQAVDSLLADQDLAWRSFACALLVEELEGGS